MPRSDRRARAERTRAPQRIRHRAQALPGRSALATGLLAGLLAGLGATGCASPTPPREQAVARESLSPLGPGQVFASAELAVLDALAWCEDASAAEGEARARAGTVYAVPGGFRYDAPAAASGPGGRLRYRLAPRDVLHFRFLPAAAWNASGPSANRLSERARSFVDRRDPLHRPLYFLTPDRRVRAYTGREEGTQTLARFASGVRRSDAPHTLVWFTLPASALADAAIGDGAGGPAGELALRPDAEAPRATALDAPPAAMGER